MIEYFVMFVSLVLLVSLSFLAWHFRKRFGVAFVFGLLSVACLIIFVFAAAPSVTNVKINSTSYPIYRNMTLLGFCNASDADSDNVTFDYEWYLDNASLGVGHVFGPWKDHAYAKHNIQRAGMPYTEVFNISDQFYLIAHGLNNFGGYWWNISGGQPHWSRNDSIKEGLNYTSEYEATTFYVGDTLCLLFGSSYGSFDGFSWNGSYWVNNASVDNGLSDLGVYSAPSVVNDGDTLLMLVGHGTGIEAYSYNFSNSLWVVNSSMKAGINLLGRTYPLLFWRRGILIASIGNYNSAYNTSAYWWNSSEWVNDISAIYPTNAENWTSAAANLGGSLNVWLTYGKAFTTAYNLSAAEEQYVTTLSNLSQGNYTLSCRAWDNTSYSAWNNNSIIINNSLPQVSNIWLNLTEIYDNESIAGWCNVSDLDGDLVKINYTFYVNNYSVFNGTDDAFHDGSVVLVNNLSNTNFSKGQTIILSCMAQDDYDGIFSPYSNSSQITVSNAPPVTLSANITTNYSYPIKANYSLLGWCNSSDIDGADNVSFNWTWFKDGIFNTSGSKGNFTHGNPANVANVSEGLLKGQTWTFSCMAYDWSAYGIWVNSTTISLENYVPSILETTNFTNATYSHYFIVYANVTDIDGWADIFSTNISITFGSCIYQYNSTGGNRFGAVYNCSSTYYALANVSIGFTDSGGFYAGTEIAANGYPNIQPLAPNSSNISGLNLTSTSFMVNFTSGNTELVCTNSSSFDPFPIGNGGILGTTEVGMNLNSIEDWTPAWTFVDIMKSARDWVACTPSNSCVYSKDVVPRNASTGYPLEIPYAYNSTSLKLRSYVRVSNNPHFPDGNYRLAFNGDGKVKLFINNGWTPEYDPGSYSIYISSDYNIYLEITESSVSDPVRNISLIMPGGRCANNQFLSCTEDEDCTGSTCVDFTENYEGTPWHPDFIKGLENVSTLRFMKSMAIDNCDHDVVEWDNRTPPTYFTQANNNGMSLEYVINLSNTIDANAWVCMPHEANDSYIRNATRMLKEQLHKNLYLEYSNEVWNSMYCYTNYIANRGCDLNISGTGDNCYIIGLSGNLRWEARLMFWTKRMVEMFDIAELVYADDRSRLINVFGGWSAVPSVNSQIYSYMGKAEINGVPVNPNLTWPDALAIAPYFKGVNTDPLGNINATDNVNVIMQKLNYTIHCNTSYLCVNKAVIENKGIAERNNSILLTYEAGQHLELTQYPYTPLSIEANDDPRMEDIYYEYFKVWDEVNPGGLTVLFNYISQDESVDGRAFGTLKYNDEFNSSKYRAFRTAVGDVTSTCTAATGVDAEGDLITTYISIDSSGYSVDGDSYKNLTSNSSFSVSGLSYSGFLRPYYVTMWSNDSFGAPNSISEFYNYTFYLANYINVSWPLAGDSFNSENVTMSVQTIDPYNESIWYNIDGVNYTSCIKCNTTIVDLNLSYGYQTVLVYANTTDGIRASDSVSFNLTAFYARNPTFSPFTVYANDSVTVSAVVNGSNPPFNVSFFFYNESGSAFTLVPSYNRNSSCSVGNCSNVTFNDLDFHHYENWTISVAVGNTSDLSRFKNSTSNLSISNYVPRVGEINMTPNPTTNINLSCNVSTFDADGDVITYSYKWFNSSNNVDYTYSDANDSILDWHNLTGFSYWKCEATPFDQFVNGTPVNSTEGYVVGLHFKNVSVLPQTAYSYNSLNCSNLFYLDNNTYNYTAEVNWYKNNSWTGGYNANVSCQSNSTCYTNILFPSFNVSHFDNLTCSVRANYSSLYSIWYNNTITVRNYVPISEAPSINDTSPLNTEDLSCLNGTLYDADLEDNIFVWYQWLNSSDGGSYVSVDSFNMSNVSAGQTHNGEYWKCRIWVGDSYGNSSNYTSSAVVIGLGNSAPVITGGNASYDGVISSVVNPIHNNSQVAFQYNFSDANSDSGKLYICKLNDFNPGLAGCQGGEWCNSSTNYAVGPVACTFSNLDTVRDSSARYYAFINSSLYNMPSSSSAGEFWVNHYPDGSISIASDNNGTLYNYTVPEVIVSWTAQTDLDNDTITYKLYGDTSPSPSTLLSSQVGTSYTWTISSGNTYYWKVTSLDSHSYVGGQNSSIYNFSIESAPASPPGGGGGGGGGGATTTLATTTTTAGEGTTGGTTELSQKSIIVIAGVGLLILAYLLGWL